MSGDGEAMDEPDIEAGARVIAENAVDAFMRERDGPPQIKPDARETAIGAVMLELIGVLPSEDSDQLAEACNRGLRVFARMGMTGPRVEAVDAGDGSVTMRSE